MLPDVGMVEDVFSVLKWADMGCYSVYVYIYVCT